ncbi:MAG: LytS/YhcK type 5TM receptor domain-containing protein [Halobacteriota archaeon]
MMAVVLELLLALVEKICVIVVIAYLITRTKYFMEVLKNKKFTLKNRVILISIFGAVSVFGTYSGIDVFGAIANVRDLGPMIGGLIGGPLIGVGAGLIGGVHRYFVGGFTCVPCSLATVFAGLFGGIIYLLKKGKFIDVPGAVVFAALMESFHMILILLLAQPYSKAVMVVEAISVPMIVSNSLGMAIFAFIISNLIREQETAEGREIEKEVGG